MSYKPDKIIFIKEKGKDSCVSTEKPLHSTSPVTSLLLPFLEFVLLFYKKHQWGYNWAFEKSRVRFKKKNRQSEPAVLGGIAPSFSSSKQLLKQTLLFCGWASKFAVARSSLKEKGCVCNGLEGPALVRPLARRQNWKLQVDSDIPRDHCLLEGKALRRQLFPDSLNPVGDMEQISLAGLHFKDTSGDSREALISPPPPPLSSLPLQTPASVVLRKPQWVHSQPRLKLTPPFHHTETRAKASPANWLTRPSINSHSQWPDIKSSIHTF